LAWRWDVLGRQGPSGSTIPWVAAGMVKCCACTCSNSRLCCVVLKSGCDGRSPQQSWKLASSCLCTAKSKHRLPEIALQAMHGRDRWTPRHTSATLFTCRFALGFGRVAFESACTIKCTAGFWSTQATEEHQRTSSGAQKLATAGWRCRRQTIPAC